MRKKRTPSARNISRNGRLPVGDGFGGRVKELRTDKGMTLAQLGERSALAISTISKIENGQISPTYETVLRLADGLQTDVTAMFNAGSKPIVSGRRSVTRGGCGSFLHSLQYDYEMHSADLSNKKFIPLVTRIKARQISDFPSLSRHEGEEFVYVISGTVVLYTAVYEPLRLEVGDSCYFDSTMGHACVSAGDSDALIMWVCSRVEFDNLTLNSTPATAEQG